MKFFGSDFLRFKLAAEINYGGGGGRDFVSDVISVRARARQ